MGAIGITLKVERARKQIAGVRKRYVAISVSAIGMGQRGTKIKKDAAASFNEALWANNLEANEMIKENITDMYDGLIRRSPVLTGAYRASHEIHARGISIGHEHEGFSTEEEAMDNPAIRAINRIKATEVAEKYLYQWEMINYNVTKNGNVTIVNNRPYASKIEGFTANGVYMLSLMKAEMGV